MQSDEIFVIDANNNEKLVKKLLTPLLGKSVLPTYYFVHDRIQQAAAQLLSEEKIPQVHLKLAEVSESVIPISRSLFIKSIF